MSVRSYVRPHVAARQISVKFEIGILCMKIFRGTPNLVKIEQKCWAIHLKIKVRFFLLPATFNRRTDYLFEGTGCWNSRGDGINIIRTRQDVTFYVQCMSCYTEALMATLLICFDTQVLSSAWQSRVWYVQTDTCNLFLGTVGHGSVQM